MATLAPVTDAFERGKKARAEKKYGLARECFESLLNSDPMQPAYAIAYSEVLLEMGRPGVAYHVLTNLVSVMGDVKGLKGNLAVALARCGLRNESKDVYLRAVKEHPDDYFAWANLGSIHISRGTAAQAIEYCDKALAINAEFSAPKWTKALALLELGQLAEGWDAYETGLDVENEDNSQPHRQTRNYWPGTMSTPFWDGVPGKKVAVYGEQGLGDEIMFSSMLTDLIRDCREVIYECHDRLAPVMRRSFPELEIHGTRKDQDREWPVFHTDIDAQIPIGSLAKIYRRTPESFPAHNGYLKADPVRTAAHRKRLEGLPGSGPIIGIGWHGGHDLAHQKLRSIPLGLWQPIFKLPCRFVSIQYTTQEKDRPNPTWRACEAAMQGIAHWQDVIDNFDELLALQAACDLNISVNQTAIHAAGAMNKECWVLTPHAAAWRYSPAFGDRMPWYPSVRLFRQTPEEDGWEGLIDRTATALRQKLGMNGVIHARGDDIQRERLDEVRP